MIKIRVKTAVVPATRQKNVNYNFEILEDDSVIERGSGSGHEEVDDLTIRKIGTYNAILSAIDVIEKKKKSARNIMIIGDETPAIERFLYGIDDPPLSLKLHDMELKKVARDRNFFFR
jgi:hypothetical protein